MHGAAPSDARERDDGDGPSASDRPLERALRASDGCIAAWRALALRAFQRGRWDDAAALEERALEAEHRAALLSLRIAPARNPERQTRPRRDEPYRSRQTVRATVRAGTPGP